MLFDLGGEKMEKYIDEIMLEDDEISFEKLVLMYILGKDYEENIEEDDDFEDDLLSEEEEEDYFSLAEYYYSR